MEDIAARELSLYADNTERIYRQRMAIAKNLATKKARGTYDREKSLVAWGYLAKAAAQAYVKEMGAPGDKWNVMFNKESRDAFCRAYREEFEQEYKDGEYEAILPAKYQKKATKKSTAAAMQKLAEKRDAAPTVSTPRPKGGSVARVSKSGAAAKSTYAGKPVRVLRNKYAGPGWQAWWGTEKKHVKILIPYKGQDANEALASALSTLKDAGFALYRDGKEFARGSEEAIWKWIHDNTSSSVDWALKHEGYSIRRR